MKILKLAICLISAAVLSFDAAASILKQTDRNAVEMSAAEKDGIWEIKLHFRPKSGWHIYSHRPGDLGQPTTVDWMLNGNRLVHEEWSPGEDILFKGFGLNVYKQSGLYKAVLQKNGDKLPGMTVSWTACGDECVPESLYFEITPEAFLKPSERTAALPDSGNAERRPLPLASAAAEPPAGEGNLWQVLLLAFAGGIILNFMPCVFPILFIKVMSLSGQKDRRKNIRDAWLYLAGVISCFCCIAALLWLFKARGANIGWGFQLQSPYFVGAMAALFFILGFMFLDIIKVNISLKYIPAGSFLTGLLAVLIASPCTAPFMGAALGWVLTTERSPWVYYPVFFALGLGYALPFFVAGVYPKMLQKFLPKPGKWMLVLKRLFAIPMFITGAWLLWVLNGDNRDSAVWETYNPQKVEQLTAAGEKVLVNFTAKWCITCLVNEKNVFSDKRFAELAKYHKVHLFKADWSTHNPEITKALAGYGRSSIPLYVYYDGSGGYSFWPQLLTMVIVETELSKKAPLK